METFSFTTQSRTILADLYTPVGVYMRLRDLYPMSALMESSDHHDKDNARSFIGINPIASVAIGHGVARSLFPDGTTVENHVDNSYTTDRVINDFLCRFNVSGEDCQYCGLYGYTSRTLR